ncbi:uncharacterized protein J7T54_003016 [Emericellopsis cladophorae]|uniref:Uncharacterized protein n=1 Tax=Emericellopsis cladophorae TaxID=2686198 RepID=A0A9P9XYK3_9HYPO|nr:uncharacterized protein J7T54_003016 [Emericellopsis cladophorae]KAI6780237.1 hypothetical protein J7T54_003016 [Emericellopsis cladophorae]
MASGNIDPSRYGPGLHNTEHCHIVKTLLSRGHHEALGSCPLYNDQDKYSCNGHRVGCWRAMRIRLYRTFVLACTVRLDQFRAVQAKQSVEDMMENLGDSSRIFEGGYCDSPFVCSCFPGVKRVFALKAGHVDTTPVAHGVAYDTWWELVSEEVCPVQTEESFDDPTAVLEHAMNSMECSDTWGELIEKMEQFGEGDTEMTG